MRKTPRCGWRPWAPVEGAKYTGPSEGKMTLTAQRDGLFRVNRPLLDAINQIGEITIATLPDHYPVKAGMKLCGLRIIPLVCRERELEEAEQMTAGADRPLMELVPYREHLPVGIIVTGSEVYSGRIRDRFEPVIREKLTAFQADVLGCIFCDDDLTMLLSAIEKWKNRGAKLILMTGGMSVDPDDLTPTAIRMSGAAVVTQGVPAQPGNMFTVAYLDDVTILGVPARPFTPRSPCWMWCCRRRLPDGRSPGRSCGPWGQAVCARTVESAAGPTVRLEGIEYAGSI